MLNNLETTFENEINYFQITIKTLFVNAMNFKNSAFLLQNLYESLITFYGEEMKKNLVIDDIIKNLKHYLLTKPQFIVLVVDEFDQLFLKSTFQTSLSFKLIELSELLNSRLILVGISNTMDLVYKLSQKYKHDLRHIKNVIFKPYDETKITKIIE